MFYVYEHWRPDKDVCFYVGKGNIQRGKKRRAYDIKKRNPHHMAIVSKLAKKGFCVDVRIIFETQSEEEAYLKEVERIAYWRSSGIVLANLADGGGKNSGWKLSEERRKQIGLHSRGRKPRLGAVLSDETKRKIALAHTGKKLTQSHVEAMSIAASGEKNGFFGKTHNEETRAKVAAANKRRVWSPESRAKLSATLKSRPYKKPSKTWTHGPEARENYRIAALKRWEKRKAKNAPCGT